MYRILIIFTVLFLPKQLCYGQMLVSDSSQSLKANINIGGSYNSGNLKQMLFRNSADIFYNNQNARIGLENHSEYNYAKIFGKTNENNLLTRSLIYTRLQKRWYAFAIFWLETNELRKMKPLVQAGLNLEYAWLLKKNNVGGFSLGITAEHKHFGSIYFNDNRYDGDSDINTARLLCRLHGNNIIGISKLLFSYDIYYMPSVRYADNYRIHTEASLEVPVLKWLNLRTALIYNYESIVINTVLPDDFSLTYGVSMKF